MMSYRPPQPNGSSPLDFKLTRFFLIAFFISVTLYIFRRPASQHEETSQLTIHHPTPPLDDSPGQVAKQHISKELSLQEPLPLPQNSPEPVYDTISGKEVLWQLPPLGKDVRGTVFFAHGCTHKATDFWDPFRSCPQCFGLPEDKKIVQEALNHGFAVIAISSNGPCWNLQWPPNDAVEVLHVESILGKWRKERKLDTLPMFAFGTSSGGYFISVLAHAMKLDALVIMISSGMREALVTPVSSSESYPLTLFVHMPRDAHVALRVEQAMVLLKEAGAKVEEIECKKLKITETFFSDRVDGIDEEASRKIVLALQKEGLLDAKGFLRNAPGGSNWWPVVSSLGILPASEDMQSRWKAWLHEELALAYAGHETSSEYKARMMDWFEKNSQH